MTRKTARSGSTGYLGLEVSTRSEEACRFQGHTPFDEDVSDSPSGAGLETAFWLPPISARLALRLCFRRASTSNDVLQ
jgi:hypothetical protein